MRFRFSLAILLGCLPAACSSEPEVVRACSAGEPAACPSARADVGFFELAPAEYRVGQTELRSSPCRLFYAFQPAEAPRDDTPVFVLSGGGPAASAMFLWAYLAGVVAVGDGASLRTVGPNPARLSQLGHVLYLDARNAGFSYPTLTDPSQRSAREAEFAAQNYNVYQDAADHLRALLEFLRRYPELVRHPLYLLGESYGGMRVTAMLNLVLHAEEYSAGRRSFVAPTLLTQLDQAALELAGQILVQPMLAGRRQTGVTAELYEAPGSILDQLASQVGTTYLRCRDRTTVCNPFVNALSFLAEIDRSPYDYRVPWAWLAQHSARVAQMATHRSVLAELMGVDTAALDRALGAPRTGAYRFADPARGSAVVRGELEQYYGAVEPWDAHFVPINREAADAFTEAGTEALGVDAQAEVFGELFLENLRQVPTLLTRASYDLVVYGPALVPVLKSYPEVLAVSLESAEALEQMRVDYVDGSTRTVLSPVYASSHSVPRDQPLALMHDITSFLAQSE